MKPALRLCEPCDDPYKLEDVIDGLMMFGRALARTKDPPKAWELAAEIVKRNVTHISHCQVVVAANVVPPLIYLQNDPIANVLHREKAGALLQQLNQVARATMEDDEFPDCAETQLLLSLVPRVLSANLWGLPGVRIVHSSQGEEVLDDVVVIDSEEVSSYTTAAKRHPPAACAFLPFPCVHASGRCQGEKPRPRHVPTRWLYRIRNSFGHSSKDQKRGPRRGE